MELDKTRAEKQKVFAQRIAAVNDINNETGQINNITGRNIILSNISANYTPPKLSPDDPEYWIKEFSRSSQELYLAVLNRKLSEGSLSQSKSSYYPKLDFFGSVKSFSTTVAKERQITEEYIVGLQFSVNLFSGGTTHAGIKRYASLLETSLLEEESLLKQKRLAITSSLEKMKGNYLLIDANARLVEVEEALFANANIAHDNRRFTNLDVLDAQKRFYEAKKEHTGAILNQVQELLVFYKEVGILDDARFNEIFSNLLS